MITGSAASLSDFAFVLLSRVGKVDKRLCRIDAKKGPPLVVLLSRVCLGSAHLS